MADLSTFLLARIAEDEADARGASPGPWLYTTVESVGGGALYDKTRVIGSLDYEQLDDHDGSIVRHLLEREADANGAHIARHDPARVLAECEAKRRIVALHERLSGEHATHPDFPDGSAACVACGWSDGWYAEPWPCETLKALAVPYADHPDYDESWRP